MGIYADYVFPHILDFVMNSPGMRRDRERLLVDARGEVLEIGFGTGRNLPYYPRDLERLCVIDSAQMLRRRVERRVSQVPFPVERHQLDAAQLPFDQGRFDCVVSTWTMCSIADVRQALLEVRRVLRPGGQLLFVEHGRSDDERTAARQDRWNPWQQCIGVGCNVNRPIDQLIRDAGLVIDRLERYLMPGTPRVLAEHYLGVAKNP